MKKITCLCWLLFITTCLWAQVVPINNSGNQLQQFYLNLDVEHLWLAGHHINWETGESDNPNATKGIKTHCSAFVAAACKKLGVYILRPPEHSDILLANAQYDWLHTNMDNSGWRMITDDNVYESAQNLANQGCVVAAVYKNPNSHKPGHIALVMPYELADTSLMNRGPMLIQAGNINSSAIQLKNGFKSHLTSWPTQEVLFYYHKYDNSHKK